MSERSCSLAGYHLPNRIKLVRKELPFVHNVDKNSTVKFRRLPFYGSCKSYLHTRDEQLESQAFMWILLIQSMKSILHDCELKLVIHEIS